jgi:predicted nucleic acid-binding protein
LSNALDVGNLILGAVSEAIPPLPRLLRVDEQVFQKAWESFATGRHGHLSFTDHTILAIMKDMKIDLILSLDSGFDGLINRVF